MAVDPYSQQLAQQLLGGSPLDDPMSNQALAQQALANMGPQPQLAPDIAAAAAPGPDLRTAELSPDFHPVAPANRLDAAGLAGGILGTNRASLAGAATPSVPAVGPAPDASTPIPAPQLAQQALAKLGKGGGPPEPAGPSTSPLDATRAVQAEMGAGTQGTTSTGGSRSVTKGLAFTPEMQAAQDASQKRFDDRVNAVEQQGNDQYAERLGAQKAKDAALAQQQRDQMGREAAARQLVDQRTASQQAVLKDYQDGKPPEAFGGSFTAGLLAAIAQGLGAFGAAKTGSPNFAQQLITGYLDREQRKWEAVQLKKKFGVESAAQLTSQARQDWVEQKTDRQATDRLIADAEIQRLQAGEKNVDRVKQLELLRGGNDQEADRIKLQMQREAQDRVTVASHSTSTGGTPGRPASLLDASVEATKRGVITPEEARQVRGQGNASSDGTMTAAEAKMKTPAQNALRTINEFAPKIGMTLDPKTGNWRALGIDSWAAGAFPGTDTHNAHENMVKALTPELTKLRTGGEGSESDRRAAEEELRTMSPEQLAATLNNVSKNAAALIATKIYHGKNQVPGAAEDQ